MSNTASIPPHHHRRATFVRWVRKTHSWFGLWGAMLGLVFGTSGIWLNHRNVLKLSVAQERINTQIALPEPVPPTPEAMGQWLQSALQLPNPPNSIRVEAAKPVAWAESKDGDKLSTEKQVKLMQPEHWSFSFGGPNTQILVDSWLGNRSVNVRRTENGFLATLLSLHRGAGMSVAWILLVDTLAGAMIFLSISGVILWAEISRRRTVGVLIFSVSTLSMLGLILSRL